MIGRTLNHYRILSSLGKGGMGEVYLAEDTNLGRKVALKILRPETAQDPDRLNRFRREARTIALLNHPNIVTIYSVEEAEGIPFLTMEYITGTSLSGFIPVTGFHIEELLRIAVAIADSLIAAHEGGVIHRDLKPANIMVSKESRVKVLDFGLAKLLSLDVDPDSSRTQTISQTQDGTILGTLPYMSPEQARGVPVDQRTDIYSFGVILYEMATGNRPYSGDSAAELLSAILKDSPAPLEAFRPDLPQSVSRLILRCLEKKREERFQTARELRNALDAVKQNIETGVVDLPVSSSSSGKTPVSSTLLDALRSFPNNLIVPATPLIGRRQELEELGGLLREEDVRLISITGPGGTGKTRLSQQAAIESLNFFPDGVFFVALSNISDVDLAPSAIAAALGLKEVGGTAPIELLKQQLRYKQLLLVLDNFEQILPAANVVSQLLEHCPLLKALVTSRAPLRIRAEREFSVSPLALPDLNQTQTPESLKQYAAIALFIQRVKSVKPAFTLTEENARTIAEICVRLDGLPLAIELAAARARLLSLDSIESRLDQRLKLLTGGARDLPAHQKTMRDTIAWSFDLLSESEQSLFRQLSVFAGGCTMEAAETVCSIDSELLDGISALLDHSLLRQLEHFDGEQRLAMLETIREYGLELLASNPETRAIRSRHAEYFLRLAERAERELTGANQERWLDCLDADHNNLRAALEWFEQNGESANGLRLSAALWRFWLVRGYLSEGRERLLRGLAAHDAPPAARAKALTGAGMLIQNQGDYAQALPLLQESLGLWRSLGNLNGEATALTNLGWVFTRLCNYSEARSLTEEAMRLHRESGNRHGVALSMNNLGWIQHDVGEFQEAARLHRETLSLRREMKDKRGQSFSLVHLARALQKLGQPEEAERCLEEALALADQVGDKQARGYALAVMGIAQFDLGREQALATLEQGTALWGEIGDRFGLAFGFHSMAALNLDLGNLTRAEQLSFDSLTLRRQSSDRRGIAECLEMLAATACAGGKQDRAAILLAAATTMRTAIGVRLSDAEQAQHLLRMEKTRNALGPEFDSLWKQGCAMSPNEAVTYALNPPTS